MEAFEEGMRNSTFLQHVSIHTLPHLNVYMHKVKVCNECISNQLIWFTCPQSNATL